MDAGSEGAAPVGPAGVVRESGPAAPTPITPAARIRITAVPASAPPTAGPRRASVVELSAACSTPGGWSFIGGFLLVYPELGIPYRPTGGSRRGNSDRALPLAAAEAGMRLCPEGYDGEDRCVRRLGFVDGSFPVAGAGRRNRRRPRRGRLGSGRVRAAHRGRVQRSRQRVHSRCGGGAVRARHTR